MEWTDALNYTLIVGLVSVGIVCGIFGFTLFTGSRSVKYRLGRRILRRLKSKRFPRCHYYDTEEGTKFGLKYPKHEWKLEFPRQPSDEVEFFGCNWNGDQLCVRVKREADHRGEVEVFLKTGGESYQLPSTPDTRAFWSQEGVFASSGLTVQCLEPMRKWRVHYNGLMQKVNAYGSKDPNDTEGVSVKFSLLWLAVSVPFDYQIDNHPDLSAKALKKSNFFNLKDDAKKLLALEDAYDEWGQFIGALKVGDSGVEREVCLWGLKEKKTPQEGLKAFQQLQAYTKEGLSFKIGKMEHDNGLKHDFGHLVLPNRCNHPVEHFPKNVFTPKQPVSLKAGGRVFNFKVEELERKHLKYGKTLDIEVEKYFVKVTLDRGQEGFGVLIKGKRCKPVPEIRKELLLEKDLTLKESTPFVTELGDLCCSSSVLVGGKALSLHFLNKMAEKCQFTVPSAFVVTTAAYRKHLQENTAIRNLIEELAKHAGEQDTNELKKWCDQTVAIFHETPMEESVKKEVEKMFLKHFKEYTKLSVRSSAAGEDSIETSAAGQNDTYLGVKGFDEVCQAICKCWGSQFSHIAIQYKKQNGQLLDSGMGVVVQEMVDSEVAGVMFTCDPVTGNTQYLNISANYGLGESVVDGTVEPDNIILRRNLKGELAIDSYTVGKKEKRVKMKSDGGIEEEILQDAGKCLTDENVMKLANIGLKIEDGFNSLRDIEWAISSNKIYMLQARPVTTHLRWSEIEMIHEFDTGLPSDHDCISVIHTGEILPNPMSPLTMSLQELLNATIQRCVQNIRGTPFHPQFRSGMVIHRYRTTFNLLDVLPPADPANKSVMGRFWELSMAGRLLDEYEELQKLISMRHGVGTSKNRRNMMFFIFRNALKVKRKIRKVADTLHKMTYPGKYAKTAEDIVTAIMEQDMSILYQAGFNHLTVTILSSIANSMILNILAKSIDEYDNETASDLAVVLAGCGDVESGDVPALLKEMASAICSHYDPEEFSSQDTKLALEQLQQDNGPAGKKFKEFLKFHGHRCISEFDLKSITWGMDPLSLIASLQAMAKNPSAIRQKKEQTSASEAIDLLKKPPTSKKARFILKWLIRFARFGIQCREKTKSCLVKMSDIYRHAFRHLGEVMEAEGRLPDRNLVFYFTANELQQLVATRSADLIAKAKRRLRLKPTLDAMLFHELYIGVPVQLKSEGQDENEFLYISGSEVELKGTPVCQGIVKATAKVVLKVEDAGCIQAGDILITPCTDIGWTPYFPLLKGMITEVGGLISHGAVVAREYGLPCLIGVTGATKVFKSRDEVIIDATKGIIRKVQND